MYPAKLAISPLDVDTLLNLPACNRLVSLAKNFLIVTPRKLTRENTWTLLTGVRGPPSAALHNVPINHKTDI